MDSGYSDDFLLSILSKNIPQEDQMTILTIENGIKVKINEESHTASITKSPNVHGNVHIPKSVAFEGQPFDIISIEDSAFADGDFKSMTFPEDSAMRTFGARCFCPKLEKLFIPASVKEISDNSFSYIYVLDDIKVSRDNTMLCLLDKKYLVGKSNEHSDIYDILHFVVSDIKKIVIPETIKFIKPYALQNKSKAKSLEFKDNPEYRIIDDYTLNSLPITKLILSEFIQEIRPSNFDGLLGLETIKIPSDNHNFIYIDNKYLVAKGPQGNFNRLIFGRRDNANILIPAPMEEIGPYAFPSCKNLKSLQFEPNSSCKKIGYCAFQFITGIGSCTIPESVEIVESSAFYGIDKFQSIRFESKKLTLDISCISACKNISSLFVTQAFDLTLNCPNQDSINRLPNSFKINTSPSVKLSGNAVEFLRERKCLK